jgi:serine/threonine-protein kinase/endoribonuclease IRE1
MARLLDLFLAVFLLLIGRCLAKSSYNQELARPAGVAQDQHHSIPPVGSSHTHGSNQEDLEMLNVVLLASVDGKLHALNRSTGETLWSMSSDTASVPSMLGPLVRTQHITSQLEDLDDDSPREFYVIEPQSGDVFVMSSSNGPLHRLPFSLPQLVDLSPFRYSEDDDPKVFVGRKETSFLLLELETGKVKATINSECPWDPFEDPFEDLKQMEDETDLDELDGTKPPKLEKATEVFIGRTGELSCLVKYNLKVKH